MEWLRIASILTFTSFLAKTGFGLLSMLTDSRVVVVDVGESVLLECQFYADQFNLFDYPVLWTKTQVDEVSQMNIMGNINEPFLREDRFEATFSLAAPRYSLQLSISAVELEDSGNYTCELRGPHSVVLRRTTHYVFVRANVISVTISDTQVRSSTPLNALNSVLHLVENRPTKLQCVSLGGYPPPRLQLTLDRRDVTSEFTLKESIETSGLKGLRRLEYRGELSTYSFVSRREDDNMWLNCHATVPGRRPFVESVKLNIDYSPQIDCPAAAALMGDKDFRIECRVIAKPRPTTIFWLVDNNGTRLDEGVINGDHSVMVSDRDDGVVMAELFLREVRRESFRSYTVVAENEIAVVTKDILLTQKYKTISRQKQIDDPSSREFWREPSRDIGRRSHSASNDVCDLHQFNRFRFILLFYFFFVVVVRSILPALFSDLSSPVNLTMHLYTLHKTVIA